MAFHKKIQIMAVKLANSLVLKDLCVMKPTMANKFVGSMHVVAKLAQQGNPGRTGASVSHVAKVRGTTRIDASLNSSVVMDWVRLHSTYLQCRPKRNPNHRHQSHRHRLQHAVVCRPLLQQQ